MNLKATFGDGTLGRLMDVLGPAQPFGSFWLWTVPRPGGEGVSIKVWARRGASPGLWRVWVFYPGLGDDRDAEEFRVCSQAQLEDVLRRIGEAALRRR